MPPTDEQQLLIGRAIVERGEEALHILYEWSRGQLDPPRRGSQPCR
jgi:hypothetical protein